MREASGMNQDFRDNKIVYLDPATRKRPVQRMGFHNGSGGKTTVYYWHYTFEPTNTAGLSFLQVLHQKMIAPAPSITVQVATAAPLNDDVKAAIEEGFLPMLDEAMQGGLVTFPSRVGCDRLPVAFIRE